MRKLAAKVDAAEDLYQSSYDVQNLLGDGGADYRSRLYWDSAPLLRTFNRILQGKKDLPKDLEWYRQNQLDRQALRWALEDAQKELAGRGAIKGLAASAADFDQALKSRDFADNRKWYEDVSDAEIRTIREGVDAALDAKEQVDYLLKRLARERETEMVVGLPPTAEMGDVETLYHASVNAKALFQKGFSDKMPSESSSAGLGGSQSLGSGKGSGISFTDDLYVAKEIARVFKEVAMIARGELKQAQVSGWVQRSPHTKKIMDWYQRNHMPCGRECSMSPRSPMVFTRRVINDEHVADVKSGRAEYDPRKSWKNEIVPASEVYPGKEGVMGLYLSYLNYSGRYDPKFFGVGGAPGLVKRFKNLNPKNIGYIEASVNTAHPDATYGKGEREVRVPPEAVLSVDKFIG